MKKILTMLMTTTLIAILAFGLVGCSEDENTIIGTWSNESFTYTFNENGDGWMRTTHDDNDTEMDISWEIEDDMLFVDAVFSSGDTMPFMNFTYNLEGNTLYLYPTDPTITGRWIFTRQ